MSGVAPAVPEDDDVLAAEFAFGLLDPDDLAASEQRLSEDPAFAAAVSRWLERLVGLLPDETLTDVAPRSGVWAAIEAATAAAPGIATLQLRRSLRRWKTATAGLAAIAAALLALLLVRPQPIRTAPAERLQLVALLDAGTAPLQGAATYDAATHRITVRLHHLRPDARVPELWLIGPDGTPRSLGVIGTPEVWSRLAPEGQIDRLTTGVTLAISLEPDGGSRTGKPTGPVILSGKLS